MIHARAVVDARARLVVFPELSLTGYELDAALVEPGDAALDPFVAACAATGSTALVGAPVPGPGGRAYIAMLEVSPGGVAVLYRKQWIGGDEAVAAGRTSPLPVLPGLPAAGTATRPDRDDLVARRRRARAGRNDAG